MSKLRAWLQAARPLAYVNIAMPLLVGQALAWVACGRFDWGRMGLIMFVAWIDQLFIVFANDLADRDADAKHPAPTIFSGGSGVLREGKLTSVHLRRAAVGMAVFFLLLCIVTALRWGVLSWLFLGPAAIALLWAYSFPPLRLSYRGGGEWLQGLGLGVVLPLLGFSGQSGSLDGFPWPALAPLFLLGAAGNILTSLPDEVADRTARKKSYAVRCGFERASRHAMELTVLAGLASPWVLSEYGPLWAIGLALPSFATLLAARSARAKRKVLPFVFSGASALNLLYATWIAASFFKK